MQQTIEERVREYCIAHGMFDRGDGVVLGVSGGADSVCLLFVLLALKDVWQLRLHVVHVNHGIRKEAVEDAAYVEKLCREYEVPFYLYEKDIPKWAKDYGCSEEEAGRRVRYEAFGEVLRQQKCQKIAVAHNSNDCAETMLFHLFRGTGLTGLLGIRPVRDQIVRPILCLERAEIEEYLSCRQIPFRHDATNDSDDYTRNKIRHNILPYAEREIVKGAVANMMRTTDILTETENYIEEQVQKAYQSHVMRQEDEYRVQIQGFLREPVLLQKRLLLRLLKELAPGQKDIGAVHVEDCLCLTKRDGNRCIHLPYSIRADRVYGELILSRMQTAPICREWEPVLLNPEELKTQEQVIRVGPGHIFRLQLLGVEEDGVKKEEIPENLYTKWFDYDKIKGCISLRTRRSGDYFSIKGQEIQHHKSLKDYMIAEKIPRKRRDEIPLLAEENHVLWLVGHRMSEYYKIDDTTRRILQVSYRQNNHREENVESERRKHGGTC